MAVGGWWDATPGDGCTCGRPWHAVIPPPPCPAHPTWSFTPVTEDTYNTITVSSTACEDCTDPHSHEGGLLAVVDEWFHRHHRIPRWLSRPLCNWRDRRLCRIDGDDPLASDGWIVEHTHGGPS